jgi:hypothetical protein
MRRWIATLLMLAWLVSAPFVSAQPACEIDLSTVASLLFDAQAAASRGDTAGALTRINIAQSLLTDIQLSCGALTPSPVAVGTLPPTLTPALPPTATKPPLSADALPDLTQTFSAPDALFSVGYPANWVVGDYRQPPASLSVGGIITFGASEGGIERLGGGGSGEAWLPSDPVVQVIVGDPVALLTGVGLYDTAAALPTTAAETASYAYESASARVTATLAVSGLVALQAGEREAFAFSVSIEQSSAWLVFSAVDAERMALVYSVGAPSEIEFLRALALAVAETVE